jgi:uncharacterized repeat protein (TIGR03806 family)
MHVATRLLAYLALLAPFAAAARTPWDGARLAVSPEAADAYVTTPLFPDLALHHPVAVEAEPGTPNLLVVENHAQGESRSRLRRIRPNAGAATVETLLERTEHFYSVCFDPRFSENGWVYLGTNGPGANGERCSRILRLTLDRTPPHGIVAGSFVTVIEWPSHGHDGAAAAFGADGMLYVTSGDGTGFSDRDEVGQDLASLRAKVLRIDVSHASGAEPYRVPADNPFVGHAGARPETWAYGLRNPWRITADPVSGQIWVGQNGQDLRESAHLLQRGANYGWSAYEGSRPFLPQRLKGPAAFTPPTIEHDHASFRSLTGGFVYRGAKFPELVGAYLYGDYSTGRIWAARHDGQRLLWQKELAVTAHAIAGFGTNEAGDILIADHTGDSLHRLERAGPSSHVTPFPTRLSETGLFASTREHRAAPGVQPYFINVPGWHDGASARRLLAIPGEATARARQPTVSWELPDGTALAQTLSLPDERGGERRVETRLLVKLGKRWTAVTYLWNDAGDDAVLASADRQVLHLGARDWLVPSRSDCLGCHSRAANFVLSLTSAQLQRDVQAGSVRRNQLAEFIARGLLTARPNIVRTTMPLTDPRNAQATLNDRAQSYLAVNCAHCHMPDGGGNSSMNFAVAMKSPRQNLIDARPEHGDFGLPDARLVAPGATERSVLPIRIVMRGDGQMPPLGTLQPDPEGVELLTRWIESLGR